jgi:DNA-binding NarL/FixJ family response regulator
MSEANNGEDPALTPAQPKPKRHNAKLCPLAIRERIVNALAAGDSQRAIARHLRVSPMTVRVIADQEWEQVAHVKPASQRNRSATPPALQN